MIRRPIIIQPMERPDEGVCGYIYLTTNQINGKKYIGRHARNEFDPSYLGSGLALRKAVAKYGFNSFTVQAIDWAYSMNELNTKEHDWIEYLGCVESADWYNIIQGGSWAYLTESQYKDMVDKFKAFRHTPESKEKLRRAHLGTTLSPETRAKIAKAHKGKMMGKDNPNYGGKAMTPEHYKAHSSFMKGKRMSPSTEFTSENSSGGNNSQAKPVVQLTLNGEYLQQYSYLGGVSKDGFSSAAVSDCCRGLKSEYKGYRWMYKEDYDKPYPSHEME